MVSTTTALPRSIIWLCCLFLLALNVLVLTQVSRETAPSLRVQHTEGAAVDHIAFWAAGRIANDGVAAQAYDRSVLAAVQSEALGYDYRGEMPWFYSPLTQILSQPFALFAPAWSLIVWGGVGLALFLVVAWRICPDPLALLAAAVSGPVFSALFTGQIGLFIAAIAGLCLISLAGGSDGHSDERRAGLWMSLLLLKPQTVLALPIALAVTGRWRVIFVAVLAGCGLIAASLVMQGSGGWIAFAKTLMGASDYFMTGGTAEFFWVRYANIYGAARANGVPFWPATIAQAILIIAALTLAIRALQARQASPMAVAAIIAYACVVASPRIFGFDLPLLVIGALFQARAAMQLGWGRGEAAVFILAITLAEVGFLGRPHVLALIGPILIVYAYWRYVLIDAIAINRPSGQVIAKEPKEDAS